MKLTKLNLRGASHVIALMLVVVVAGVAGTYALVSSHADSLSCTGQYGINYGYNSGGTRSFAPGGFCLLDSNMPGGVSAKFVFQSDGNLVFYTKTSTSSWHAKWASGTNGKVYGGNGRLVLGDDGNVVIYNVANSGYYGSVFIQKKAVWSSGTNKGTGNTYEIFVGYDPSVKPYKYQVIIMSSQWWWVKSTTTP